MLQQPSKSARVPITEALEAQRHQFLRKIAPADFEIWHARDQPLLGGGGGGDEPIHTPTSEPSRLQSAKQVGASESTALEQSIIILLIHSNEQQTALTISGACEKPE